MTPGKGRSGSVTVPDFSIVIHRILADVCEKLPEFWHIRPRRILLVAAQARRNIRATILPMHFEDSRRRTSADGSRRKPLVRIDGKKILYMIQFRPPFFRLSTPRKRLETLLHELYHISKDFDGTLDRDRRHNVMPKSAFGVTVRALMERYLSEASAWVMESLCYNGDVLFPMWLRGPDISYAMGEKGVRKRFDDDDLYMGKVELISPRG